MKEEDICGIFGLSLAFILLVFLALYGGQFSNSLVQAEFPSSHGSGCISHPGHYASTGTIKEIAYSSSGETIVLSNGHAVLDPMTSGSQRVLEIELPALKVGQRVNLDWDYNFPQCSENFRNNHPTNILTSLGAPTATSHPVTADTLTHVSLTKAGCVVHPGHFTTAGDVVSVAMEDRGERIVLSDGYSFLDPSTGSFSHSLAVELPALVAGDYVQIDWSRNTPHCVENFGSRTPARVIQSVTVRG